MQTFQERRIFQFVDRIIKKKREGEGISCPSVPFLGLAFSLLGMGQQRDFFLSVRHNNLTQEATSVLLPRRKFREARETLQKRLSAHEAKTCNYGTAVHTVLCVQCCQVGCFVVFRSRGLRDLLTKCINSPPSQRLYLGLGGPFQLSKTWQSCYSGK